MNLWIRSQDRKDLVKVNSLWIMDNQIWMEVPFYENHKKLGLTVSGHNHKLAEYKTKERALEVLDEIQRKIEKLYALENCSLEKNSCIEKGLVMDNFNIYQMPKE